MGSTGCSNRFDGYFHCPINAEIKGDWKKSELMNAYYSLLGFILVYVVNLYLHFSSNSDFVMQAIIEFSINTNYPILSALIIAQFRNEFKI